MSSVWKRLQRVGKKAAKYQFTASFQVVFVRDGSGISGPNNVSLQVKFS